MAPGGHSSWVQSGSKEGLGLEETLPDEFRSAVVRFQV
jgi:hypothetical protein